MDKIAEIWEYLATIFDNECLADEILSFSVEMECKYENFALYPFIIYFPGLEVRLINDWQTELEDCLSIKFICNLKFPYVTMRNEAAGAIVKHASGRISGRIGYIL